MSAQHRFAHCAPRYGLVLLVTATLATLAGCAGDGGGGPVNDLFSGPSVSNRASVTVDLGPAGNDANVLFVTVTVCAPGSATNCQTVDHVSVDTGSSGLRLLESALPASFVAALPQENAASGSPLGNCAVFADNSFTWGLVKTADIKIAGEAASSVPVEVISASGSSFFGQKPSACSGTLADNTTANLGGNGLLGVGVFRQDCGPACVANTPPPDVYFSCPTSGCAAANEPLTGQLQNPVWMFAQDNNGLSIQLPQIPAQGQATVAGTMTFGIGTQSNNALGSATIFTTDPFGDFTTIYNGQSYPQSHIDSGSNGIFFLTSAKLMGMPDCGGQFAGFYCPASPQTFAVTNKGQNGKQGPVTFNIENAQTLINSNPSFSAFNDLGGVGGSSTFDFGLPFFFSRTVFVGIEGQSANGTFWAF